MNMDQDSRGPELREALDALSEWLDAPQEHLNSLSRKRSLELVLIGFADKVRAKEARKLLGQAAIMWGSLCALVLTLGPKAVDLLKVTLGVTP